MISSKPENKALSQPPWLAWSGCSEVSLGARHIEIWLLSAEDWNLLDAPCHLFSSHGRRSACVVMTPNCVERARATITLRWWISCQFAQFVTGSSDNMVICVVAGQNTQHNFECSPIEGWHCPKVNRMESFTTGCKWNKGEQEESLMGDCLNAPLWLDLVC